MSLREYCLENKGAQRQSKQRTTEPSKQTPKVRLLLLLGLVIIIRVHENFSEALERLFIRKFLPEHSDTIQKLVLIGYSIGIEDLLNDAERYNRKG